MTSVHRFSRPILALPVFIRVQAASDTVRLQSFRRIQAPPAPPAHLLAATEAAAFLDAPLANCQPRRLTPPDSWIDGAAFGQPGAWFAEIGSVALLRDPVSLGPALWCDRAEWHFDLNANGWPLAPVNHTLRAALDRQPSPARFAAAASHGALTLLIPFASDDFSAATVFLKYNADIGFAQNFGVMTDVDAPPMGFAGNYQEVFGVAGFWPVLGLSGPDTLPAEGSGEYALTLTDPESGAPLIDPSPIAWLEATAGYLPKRRVAIAGGTAAFRLAALGLEAGDRIKLKAGWRFHSGLAEKEIAIV